MEKQTLGELLDAQAYHGELLELLNLSGGEITEEIETRMVEIAEALPAKVDSFHHFLENCEFKIEQLRHNADFSTKRARALTNIVERAREYFVERMKLHDLKELKGNQYKYKLIVCPKRLIIEDETKIPEKFFIITRTVDKPRIKEALLAGEDIPGAHLEGGEALRSYSAI